MELQPILGIKKGVTAVIGSGGKSTLLHTLAQELPGRILLCTSTHFMPYDDLPSLTEPTEETLRQAFTACRVVCAGRETVNGKLTDCGLPYEILADLADYVLVEADGSRRFPLKAHAPHEPVIPGNCRRVVCVVGLSGLHRPVREAVHRPEIFCPHTGCTPEDEVTAELVARGLIKEHLADTYLLNQMENENALQDAKIIASALKSQGCRVIGGSQRNREYKLL